MGGLGGGMPIGVPPVIHHGSEEQKRRWLPGIFPGTTSFCLGATEPTGAYLDIISVRTELMCIQAGLTLRISKLLR